MREAAAKPASALSIEAMAERFIEGLGRRSMGNGAMFLVAAHNRRELTVRALSKAFESARAAGLSPHAVLFDDASTDGTAEAVRAALGESVTVIRGHGSAFWASSMAQSERHASRQIHSPTFLCGSTTTSTQILTRCPDLWSLQRHTRSEFVASTRDPENGALTYGGMARSGIHPLAFSLMEPP